MTFPHSATIKRTTKEGTKYTFATLGTATCFLQPLDVESAQALGISFSQSSKLYLPISTDISSGDRVVIDGITYGVKGVQKLGYGSLEHKKAILEEQV